jgi:hypothetical protein
LLSKALRISRHHTFDQFGVMVRIQYLGREISKAKQRLAGP